MIYVLSRGVVFLHCPTTTIKKTWRWTLPLGKRVGWFQWPRLSDHMEGFMSLALYICICCLGLQSTNPSFSRLYMCVHIPCILDHEAMPQAWPCKPILTVNFHGLETGHPTACDKPVRSCHMRQCRNLRCLAMQQVLDTPFIITTRWHFQHSIVQAKPSVFPPLIFSFNCLSLVFCSITIASTFSCCDTRLGHMPRDPSCIHMHVIFTSIAMLPFQWHSSLNAFPIFSTLTYLPLHISHSIMMRSQLQCR